MSTQKDALPSAPPPKQFTWKTCNKIVLLVMGAGVILATLRPVWLAPPLLQYTPLIYLSLALVWLPVLSVCAILRPIGGWRNPVKLVVLGLLVSLLWGTLSCPSLGTEMWAPLRVLNCRTEPLPGNQTRYTCTSTGVFVYTTYVFEGPNWSPFVRLVKREEGSS